MAITMPDAPIDWARRGIDLACREALEHGLPASELRSLLLAVAERRAAAATPASVMQQWTGDRFVEPSMVDQRRLRRIELQLLEAASAFQALELSPLAPLGSCTAVAPGSQNRIVSTVRGTEVVADPTHVLALVAAQRLRADAAAVVKLATAHRCVRAQPVPPGAGFQAHFSLFSMASAGHERAGHGFVVDAMVEQISVLVSALMSLGLPMPGLRLLATPQRQHLAQQVAGRVSARWPTMPVAHEGAPPAYYDGLRFMIDGLGTAGERYPLADGGAFDWLQRLASNHKLAFVASGLGTQLLAARTG
jgi:hypothetical protein